MNKTAITVVLIAVAGVAAWYFLFRRPRGGATNGMGATQAHVLPAIQPDPGSSSRGWQEVYGQGVGAATQAACVANGGGPLCGMAGSVATKVGTVYAQGATKVGGAVVSAGKSVASGAKKVLGKIF